MTVEETPLDPLLTAAEQQLWQSLIRVVLSLPVVLDRDLQQREGVSHFEFSLMARLSEAPERRLRLTDLARETGSTVTRLSRAVTRGEVEGWIAREPDPADGRATLVMLTSTGFDRLAALAPGHIAQVRHLILDPLTAADRRALTPSLEKIAAAVTRTLYAG